MNIMKSKFLTLIRSKKIALKTGALSFIVSLGAATLQDHTCSSSGSEGRIALGCDGFYDCPVSGCDLLVADTWFTFCEFKVGHTCNQDAEQSISVDIWEGDCDVESHDYCDCITQEGPPNQHVQGRQCS